MVIYLYRKAWPPDRLRLGVRVNVGPWPYIVMQMLDI